MPPTPEGSADPSALLAAVGLPLLQVGPAHEVLWQNGPARALGAPLGGAAAALFFEGAAWLALCGPQPCQAELPAADGQRWFRVQSIPLPSGGWAWTLQDCTALHASQREVARLSEQMELARGFGRLGLWERNVRTLEGHWDRQVMRFWGQDPARGTPHFAEALQNILEVDREALGKTFTDSLRQAGHYAARYRVRGLDGTVRRIHSQWRVINGPDGQRERVLGMMMDDTEPYGLAQSANELESQLALSVELAGISIWRHDLATGRTHFSPQGWRALGLAPRREGMTLDEVRQRIHPDDLPAVVASAEAALSSPVPVDLEARYLHADGHWCRHMLRRMVLRDDQGQPTAFLGVALDVTEQHETRRRADQMARRFEVVTRAAGIGHWLFEPDRPEPSWSEQLRVIFGLTPHEPVPTLRGWLRRHVHPEDRPALRRVLEGWAAGGTQDAELAFRAVRRDGEVRQLFSHSRVEASERGRVLFGVVIDITEQRRSELALRSAEERATLAVRGAGVGTWELDPVSGQTHWDEHMWRLRGHEPQPRPMTLEERQNCVHPEDRARTLELNHQASESTEVFDHQFRIIRPDGQVRWLASRSASILAADGSGRRRRIGVNWDVTDSRTADTARREREVALRESEAKSQFMARMSHELRTPLNAVLGFAQLLLDDEPHGAQGGSRRRWLEHIHSAGRHLLSLINDVLELSGVAGGEVRIALQPVPLQPLVDSTLPLLGPLLDKQQVPVQRGALDLAVMADATRLRQVLLNLLSNAIKYNRPDGHVRVEAEARGEQVVLRVADTGRGMNAAQVQHLFEPFNRLGADPETIEGTGIGLAIVKALVERMGGHIRVQSEPGAGSMFEITLAAAAAGAAALPAEVAPRAPAAFAPQAARRRLLYIEDNPVNALIISELLGRRGDLALHVATDGASGVAQAQALAPDLILLDMQLPDFDGYEVLRRLRAAPRTAGIPCIALSANAMPEDIERALRAGVSDYWTKPLDFKAFLANVDALFGKPA